MRAHAGRAPARTAALRLPGAGALLAAVRRYDPLLRNGHLLTASSLLTAGVGAAYWALAAHLYGPDAVGRTYSAISAAMFLAGVGQLNLANIMVRFVPAAGTGTRRLVLLSYLAAGATALLLGAGFVLLTPRLVPALSFLHTVPLGVGFALGTAGYALFVLQDGVLTGLRRADWVVMENGLFSVVKIGSLAVFTGAGATAAILGSWATGLLVALVFTNVYVFTRAVPRHERLAAGREPPGRARDARPTAGYLAADWFGSLCWLAAITLPPIIVLGRVGAAASAYFSVAWLIAYALYQFAINMCASMMVEAATAPARLRAHHRQMLRHAALVLSVGVALVVVAAPWLLRLFGPDYTRGGTTTLRLLALSALPNLVVTAAIAVSRVLRRMRVVVVVLGVLTALVLGLTVALIPALGVPGAGLAWLLAQCAVAAALLLRRSWWLPAVPVPDGAGGPAARRQPVRAPAGLLSLVPIRRPWPLSGPVDRRTARRIALALGPDRAPDLHLAAQGLSDVLVMRRDTGGAPDLAVKHPRNRRAADSLAHEWQVLTALAADARLGEWRNLLPATVSCRLEEPLPVLEEGWLPGVSAEALLRRDPGHARQVTGRALDAIAGLHLATGRVEPAADHLARWVDDPLDALARDVRWCRGERGRAALAALRVRLHDGLADRRMLVAWTHGDYHPGNILFSEDRTRVTGVIDWCEAHDGGPSEIDVYGFVLALRCVLSGRQLGRVVRGVVRTGSLAPEDLSLLPAGGAGPVGSPQPPAAGDDGAALPLLAWLWHVDANLAKSPRYARSRWWVTGNVIPVLEEVARCPAGRQ